MILGQVLLLHCMHKALDVHTITVPTIHIAVFYKMILGQVLPLHCVYIELLMSTQLLFPKFI